MPAVYSTIRLSAIRQQLTHDHQARVPVIHAREDEAEFTLRLVKGVRPGAHFCHLGAIRL